MNTIERKISYTAKQYKRMGFGHSYYFVDAYENARLMYSIMLDQPLSDDEMERFLNVFVERLNKGDDVCFFDSTEKRMNELFKKNKYRISALENTLASKMGKEKFDVHYEKRCYYLAYIPSGYSMEVDETLHISGFYNPLMCLKMAHQLGEKTGSEYRILLSDHLTEVDADLLAFAIDEK